MITFTLDPLLVIQLLVSTVLPLLVGLVTKQVTRPGFKALLLALLALVTSLLTELGAAIANGVPYDVGQGLLLAIPTFLIAVGLHYGLWKPTGVSEKAQALFDSKTITVRENEQIGGAVVNILASDPAIAKAAEAAVDKALRGQPGWP